MKKLIYANGLVEEYVYNALDMLSEVWYTTSEGKTLAYKYSYASNGALLEFEDCLTGDITYYTYTHDGLPKSVRFLKNKNLLRLYVIGGFDVFMAMLKLFN